MVSHKGKNRRESFADIIKGEGAAKDKLDGRAVNRVRDRDLWDENGHHWQFVEMLHGDEVEALLDSVVRVGAASFGARTLEWITVTQHRRQEWRERIQPFFVDEPGEVPRGEVQFTAELWRRGRGGEQMILFQEWC